MNDIMGSGSRSTSTGHAQERLNEAPTNRPIQTDLPALADSPTEELIGLNEAVAQRFRRRLRLDYRQVIRRILQAAALSPGDRVLDIPLYDGSLALQMVSEVAPAQIICACPQEETLQKIYKQAQGVGLEEHIDWRLARLEELAFPGNQFDVVTCGLSFRWLPTEQFITEAYRLLAPGGRLVVTELLVPTSKVTDWRLAGRSFYHRFIAKDKAEADATFHTSEELGNLLHEAGFHSIMISALQKPLTRYSWVFSLVKAIK